MLRRGFIKLATVTLTAAAALVVPAGAQQTASGEAGTVQATAAQIQHLLSGNTIKGSWSGADYTQYFDQSGFTVYIEAGRPPSRGKWRVREDTDQYDSWWENTGWTPYTVMMTNDGYAWVNRGELEPFEILEGKQADF
ncbi:MULTISPECIES: hypothetical protein [unclassified Roseovarius]|uniref:hypothetical protein n=1 Tax=unclassified Roseovarius TaxID=2614913 RepID=UPI00273E4A20|nr:MULTISPECIES: hypothetical protein [unclassified Roseovarius]